MPRAVDDRLHRRCPVGASRSGALITWTAITEPPRRIHGVPQGRDPEAPPPGGFRPRRSGSRPIMPLTTAGLRGLIARRVVGQATVPPRPNMASTDGSCRSLSPATQPNRYPGDPLGGVGPAGQVSDGSGGLHKRGSRLTDWVGILAMRPDDTRGTGVFSLGVRPNPRVSRVSRVPQSCAGCWASGILSRRLQCRQPRLLGLADRFRLEMGADPLPNLF